jgi:hypothetical protein
MDKTVPREAISEQPVLAAGVFMGRTILMSGTLSNRPRRECDPSMEGRSLSCSSITQSGSIQLPLFLTQVAYINYTGLLAFGPCGQCRLYLVSWSESPLGSSTS